MTVQQWLVAALVTTALVATTGCKTACDDESPCPPGTGTCFEGFCALDGAAAGEEGEGEEGEGEGEENEGEGEEGEGEGEEGEGEGEEGEGEGEEENEGEGERLEECQAVGDEDLDGFADCADADCHTMTLCLQCRDDVTLTALGDVFQFEATASAYDGVDTTYFAVGNGVASQTAGIIYHHTCEPEFGDSLQLNTIDAGRNPAPGGTQSAAVAVGIVSELECNTGGQCSDFTDCSFGAPCDQNQCGCVTLTTPVYCLWIGDNVTSTITTSPNSSVAIGVDGYVIAEQLNPTTLQVSWVHGTTETTTLTVDGGDNPFRLVRSPGAGAALYLWVQSELHPIRMNLTTPEQTASIELGEPLAASLPFATYETNVASGERFVAFEDAVDFYESEPWLQRNGRAGIIVGQASLGVQPAADCGVAGRVVVQRQDEIVDAVRLGADVVAITARQVLRWRGDLTQQPDVLVPLLAGAMNRLLVTNEATFISSSNGQAVSALNLNAPMSLGNTYSYDEPQLLLAGFGEARLVGAGSREMHTLAGMLSINDGEQLSIGTSPGVIVLAASAGGAEQKLVVGRDEFFVLYSCDAQLAVGEFDCEPAVGLGQAPPIGMFVTNGVAVIAQQDDDGVGFLSVVGNGSSSPDRYDFTVSNALVGGVGGVGFYPRGDDLVIVTNFGLFQLQNLLGTASLEPIGDIGAFTPRYLLTDAEDLGLGQCTEALSIFGAAGSVCFGGQITARDGYPSGRLLFGSLTGADNNSAILYEMRSGKTFSWLVE